MWISKSEADYVANGKVGRMSVLIKDMDLPKKCGECDIYVCYRTWNGDPGDEFCGITKEDVSRETKPDWCPLKGIIMSEVPEREKGEWIKISKFDHSYKCSICGRTLINITDGKNTVAKNYPFCHCGSDMRGKHNE